MLLVSLGVGVLLFTMVCALVVLVLEQLVVRLVVGGCGSYPRSAHGYAAYVPLGILTGLTSGLLGVVVHDAIAW